MNDDEGLKTLTIEIEGMQCERCVALVQDSLLSVEGVDSTEVSLGKAEVHYLPQLVSSAHIEQAVADAGYAVRQEALRKGFWGRFIDRMIASNQKNFGDERLDCCKLSSKDI